MSRSIKTISPVDGRVYVERPLATDDEIRSAVERARADAAGWRELSIAERSRLLHAFVDQIISSKDKLAEELSWQMGRPVRHGPGELGGFEERARYMIDVAEEALENIRIPEKEGFERFITREPLGLVLVIAPWNYPWLTSVNAVVPALMAGNAVLLKHSAQTPLVAERYTEAARAAGLPRGVFQHLHLGHEQAARLIGDPAIGYVAFTGSVEGGRAVRRAAVDRFISLGLELGGKDPAYVRPDADLRHAVETLVDGALFNAGQSCCGVKRIYVHEDVYDAFVEDYVEEVYRYATLGDPLDPGTTLGPVVRAAAALAIRAQVKAAALAGARALVDESRFPKAKEGTPYMAPAVLVDVDHSMDLMREETFGPAVGIMKVASDDHAVRLMNDCRFGLTAAVFTPDTEAALSLGRRVETGTWFLNRCDYLDPALAWVGVKDSGSGCTLSRVGYENLTRPKSFHLKVEL